MYKIIWITVAVLAVVTLLWFCWLVFQLADLVACSNVPFDELTAHCAKILR